MSHTEKEAPYFLLTHFQGPLTVVNGSKQKQIELFRVDIEQCDMQPNSQLTPRTTVLLQNATKAAPVMLQAKVISNGWPKEKSQLPLPLTPYWNYCD